MTAPTSSKAMISQDKLSELQGKEDSTGDSSVKNKTTGSPVKTEEGENFVVSLPTSLIHLFFSPINTFS